MLKVLCIFKNGFKFICYYKIVSFQENKICGSTELYINKFNVNKSVILLVDKKMNFIDRVKLLDNDILTDTMDYDKDKKIEQYHIIDIPKGQVKFKCYIDYDTQKRIKYIKKSNMYGWFQLLLCNKDKFNR